jgi:ribosomal-protein-alanine N-acetyltransferase
MVRVRVANGGDVGRMMEIASHAATAAHWNSTEYARLFAPDTGQERISLVVEESGQVAGFLIAKQIHSEWEIENVAVSGQARRRGLGTRLMGEFIELVKSRGGQAIYLEVRESNVAARMLYGKWAFQEAGRRKMYYENPSEDALVYKFSC